MFRYLLFLVVFLLVNIGALQLSDACSLYEHEKKGKKICQIKKGEVEVGLYYFKSGCEFPEGQKNDCIYSIACKGKRTYRGTPILNGKKSLKALCLTSTKTKGKDIKKLFEHEGISTSVELDCSSISKNPAVALRAKTSVKSCPLNKFID